MRNPSKRRRRDEAKPTLRERAAALKATAGRVMRRKPRSSAAEEVAAMVQPVIESERVVSVPEGSVTGASPGLTKMVEAWQALAVQIEGENIADEVADALSHRRTELQIAICRFPAASVADLLAKVPVFRDEMRDAIGGLHPEFRPEDTLSGAAWLGLFRDFERLSAVASPERAEPAGDDLSEPGFVLFEDTAGLTRREPVAEWIAFMAQRLYHVARSELVRQFNVEGAELSGDASDALHDRLRRELRVDALHDLAFRSREVFEASWGYGVGDRWRYGGAADGSDADPNGALVREILAGWKAWADLDLFGWSGDVAAGEALIARRDVLIDAADRLPANLASLPVKALALAWLEYVDLWEVGRSYDEYAVDGRLALDIHEAAVAAEAAEA